eukprot:GEMP01090554.1.p2 GENE.GEMP01090554.1~~GEMP01090554.1.p2  ORF type:complete len:100 (-),score=7.04 GEMP01090554.1:313-612(-)
MLHVEFVYFFSRLAFASFIFNVARIAELRNSRSRSDSSSAFISENCCFDFFTAESRRLSAPTSLSVKLSPFRGASGLSAVATNLPQQIGLQPFGMPHWR